MRNPIPRSFRLLLLFSLFLFFLPALATSLAVRAGGGRETSTPGALQAAGSGGEILEMPLRHTRVQVEVSSFVARTVIEQTFHNPFDVPVEALYTFPLGDLAAVDDFELVVGERVLKGRIERRAEARRIYEAAKAEGYQAALLDQERPNVFTEHIANLEPGYEVRVRLRTVELLPYEAGSYSYTFPLLVGPRYVPGCGLAEDEIPAFSLPEETEAAAASEVGFASFRQPPRLPEGLRSGHDVSIEVTLEAGVPLGSLESPGHEIEIEGLGTDSALIRLAEVSTIPNRDFLLRWSVESETPRVGLLAHREGLDGFLTLLVQPKGEVAAHEAAPKEIVLVLDTSGSMYGAPLAASKRFLRGALRSLGPRDTFNLIRFAGDAELFAPEPLPNDEASVEEALAWVEELKGGGGTEMLKGFRRAFKLPQDPDRLRMVIFLTDGQIGTESQILTAIRPVLGEARIHTLGVGPSVNHYLLDRMATLGRGSYVHILPGEKVAAAVDRFRSWVTRPYLTDLEVDWGHLLVEDIFPDPLPDLSSGQTLQVVARYLVAGEGEVVVRGKLGGRYWEQSLPVWLPDTEEGNGALASVWARRKIASLLTAHPEGAPPEVEEEVTDLALAFRLMSPYTSFVVVDDSRLVNPEGRPPLVEQALPEPAGRYNSVEDLPEEFLDSESRLYETVTVTSREQLVSLQSGGTQVTSFSDEFIDDLPVMNRNVQSMFTRAPGVNDADGDGNPTVHGARSRDFKASIDGVSNVDPVTGHTMSQINPDAVAEIEVVTSGAGAEYGGATGGFADVIIKSGGNQFEGVFNFFFRSSALDGNGATDIPRDKFDYKRIQPSINFTGPIVRNHLWFAVNHEYIKDQDPIVFVDGTSVTQTIDGWRHLDKFTWQASARNKIQFTFSADPLTWGPLGVTNLTPEESGYDYSQGGPTYQLRWTVPFSPTTSWDALVAFSDTGISWTPTTRELYNNCVTDPRGEFSPNERFGQPVSQDYCFDSGKARSTGSFLSDFEDVRQRWTYELKGERFVPEFLGADHRINIGMNVEDVFYSYDRQQRPFSNLLPVTVSDFPGLNTGNEAASKRIGGQLFRDVSLTQKDDSFFPVFFDQSRSADAMRYAAWLEDSFRPIPNLSVRLGVRFSREEIGSRGFEPFDPAAEHAAFHDTFNSCWAQYDNNPAFRPLCRIQAFDVFTGYENEIDTSRKNIVRRSGNVRVPEKFTVTNTNLDPRISISWDPWNNAKTKFYATWGRYHGDMFLLPFIAEQGPDFVTDRYEVAVNDDGFGEVGFNPAIRSAFSVSQVDRNMRSPYNDEFTIGVERELAAETSIAVTYLNRKFKDQMQDIDINHFPKDEGSTCVYDPNSGEGRAVGDPDGVYDDCGGASVPIGRGPLGTIKYGQRPDGYPDLFIYNPLFNQVFLIGNFNESEYEALQVELRRRFYKNWEMEASYVLSKAVGQAEDFNQGLGDDPTTVVDEKGFLSYDQRHFVKVNGRTYLPWWGGFRLGTSLSWQSGLPYSLTETTPVLDARTDFAGSSYQYFQNKTVYPTRQRNDQRNTSFWTIDINFQKEFQLGPTVCALQLDVFNLLNDDVMWIRGIQNDRLVASRRFGRRFQAAIKVNF